MSEIIIDQEFKWLLPALDAAAYAWLEENIVEHGCMNPLVLWNGILIDGHNRYAIVQKHGLPFNTIDMEFDSRDDVIIWMISSQISRRNLTPKQLTFFRGLHYNAEKRIITNESGTNQHSEVGYHNDNQPKMEPTRIKLAEQYNVSPITIIRDGQVAKAITAIGETSPEAKRKILSGKGNISRKQLRELSTKTNEEISETIERILDGTHEGRRTQNPENTDRQTPSGSALYEQLTLETFINRIADDFNAGIKNLSINDDAEESKAALRALINTLEDLYRQI